MCLSCVPLLFSAALPQDKTTAENACVEHGNNYQDIAQLPNLEEVSFKQHTAGHVY